MIEKLQVVRSDEQHVAMVRIKAAAHEMQTVMGPGIGEVFAAIADQGLTPAGPWFNHHFAQPTSVFDFGICVPLSSAIAPIGRVEASVRRACDVVRTNYHGPYEGLGDAWQQFMEAILAENHQCADDFWECYITGPESESDGDKFITELNRPLRGL